MKKRELDSVYFRVERDGHWQNICFTDLYREEQEKFLEDRTAEWLRCMVLILADTIRDIGDALDIVCEDE